MPLSVPVRVPLVDAEGHDVEEGDSELLGEGVRETLPHGDGDVDTVTQIVGEPLCETDAEEDADVEGLIVPDTVTVGDADCEALGQLVLEVLRVPVSDDVTDDESVADTDEHDELEGLSVPVSDDVRLGVSVDVTEVLGVSVPVTEPQVDTDGDEDTVWVGVIVGVPLAQPEEDVLGEPLGLSVVDTVEQIVGEALCDEDEDSEPL